MTDNHGQAPNENEENKEPEAQTPESDNVEELLKDLNRADGNAIIFSNFASAKIPFDTLKIDKSFIERIGEEARNVPAEE